MSHYQADFISEKTTQNTPRANNASHALLLGSGLYDLSCKQTNWQKADVYSGEIVFHAFVDATIGGRLGPWGAIAGAVIGATDGYMRGQEESKGRELDCLREKHPQK